MPPGQRLAHLAAEAVGAPTPGAALRRIRSLRQELDAFERAQVAEALAEGKSFAAIARELGLSRQAVHRRFRSLSAAEAPAATDVSRVLACARDEARAVGAEDVRSEHVLLGVLRADDSAAAILLRAAGVTLERARSHVQRSAARTRLFARGVGGPEPHGLVAASTRERWLSGRSGFRVEQLMLKALEDRHGGAAHTLRALGVDPDAVRAQLRALLETYSARPARAPATRRPGELDDSD